MSYANEDLNMYDYDCDCDVFLSTEVPNYSLSLTVQNIFNKAMKNF